MNWLSGKLFSGAEKSVMTKIQTHKEKFKLSSIHFASHSIQGEGPKKTECQDSYTVIEDAKEGYYALSVLDGHGSSGKEASNSASDNLQKYFEKHKKEILKLQTFKDREIFLKNAFSHTEKTLKSSGIDYSGSGTCAVFVFIKDNILTVANLGDSRAVLCRIGKEKAAIELSWDQKPTRKDEKERILASGGKIERLNFNGEYVGPFRVWADEEGPGIAMSRSLGDFQAKKIGLISIPEIDHLWLKTRDKFVVLASDGVWDVMSSAEVVGFVLRQEADWLNENTVAEKLCLEARSRWENHIEKKIFSNKVGDFPTAKNGIDDITCIIAFFNYEDTDGNKSSLMDESKAMI